MCRKNLVPAVAMVAFGVGLLAGCCINSSMVILCLALAAIAGGFCVMRHR